MFASANCFDPKLFQNKIVIVTGGASGIGKAIVRSFLQHQARVVLADLNEKQGLALVKEYEQSSIRNNISFVHANLTDEEACKKVIDYTIKKYGKIDILVNNAGANDKVDLSASPQKFKKSVKNNLMHYFTMAHFALDSLKKSQGVIINIASKVAVTGQGNTSGYAAAKGAILALTREWAVDLAPHRIRVNAIIPAEVSTEGYQQWLNLFENSEEKLKEITHKIPFEHRMTTPEEIANTVLFIASPLSSHTTGQFLYVDGGYVHFDRAYSEE